ncbi:hypothetical protein NLX86_20245 [Streptomyces sp. A3M-1-3]|uniref:hypothetical protein n=1 Tax=Streptomyces sp. A3M-1-3 TaxID=2962044 RepID=UPI0020B7FC98|nr:hypothetical protein [Streptomyces sp. A3M-1-3]MCP3820343.1 hypothetical protein [Streptomyces sp. A3M-1-3]
MHDPAAQHEDMTFDFGVTELGTSFHGDWILYADTALDHALAYLGGRNPGLEPGRVLLLIEDVLRLRDSDLTGEELSVLWLATGTPMDGQPEIGGKERASVDRLLSLIVPIARARGASEDACTTYPVCVPDGASPATVEHRRRTAEVVAMVGLLDQGGDQDTRSAATRHALMRCAEVVCAELAFRFLLCAVNSFGTPLTPAAYERLEHLAAAFGYGPHVVDAVKYLVS